MGLHNPEVHRAVHRPVEAQVVRTDQADQASLTSVSFIIFIKIRGAALTTYITRIRSGCLLTLNY